MSERTIAQMLQPARRYSDTASAAGTRFHMPHSAEGSSNSAYEQTAMRVPEELRFFVAKMVEMVDAGWEPCGFQGGGSGKVQFQKVEFRRRRRNPIDSKPIAGSRPDGLFDNRQKAERHIVTDD